MTGSGMPQPDLIVNLGRFGGGLFAAVAAFGLTLVVTRPLIAWLAARQLVKAIRFDGPDHGDKAGTPTMGGLAMLAVVALLALPLAAWLWPGRDGKAIAVTLLALCTYGALGLVDDLRGLQSHSLPRELGVGLTARRMIALQIVAALGVWIAATMAGVGWRSDWLPAPVGSLAAPLLAVLVLVGSVNGVNFADGLDGLAAGLSALAFAALATIIYSLTSSAPVAGSVAALGTLAMAIAGGCLGFLAFNRHPARVFMGNVTSMALGGALAAIALVTGIWWVLPLVGAVFVAEVLSVIVQVAYFKATGGRRVFRMAPLHHHFEKGGMTEEAVVLRFWMAGLGAALCGVAIALLAT